MSSYLLVFSFVIAFAGGPPQIQHSSDINAKIFTFETMEMCLYAQISVSETAIEAIIEKNARVLSSEIKCVEVLSQE